MEKCLFNWKKIKSNILLGSNSIWKRNKIITRNTQKNSLVTTTRCVWYNPLHYGTGDVLTAKLSLLKRKPLEKHLVLNKDFLRLHHWAPSRICTSKFLKIAFTDPISFFLCNSKNNDCYHMWLSMVVTNTITNGPCYFLYWPRSGG